MKSSSACEKILTNLLKFVIIIRGVIFDDVLSKRQIRKIAGRDPVYGISGPGFAHYTVDFIKKICYNIYIEKIITYIKEIGYMYDMKDILDRLNAGASAQDIANEFVDALNSAVQEQKVTAQREAGRGF